MQAFENHTHWTAVKEVCHRLKEAGHEALLAGGCVRDLLMGREPNDFDIATDAVPDEVERLFPQALTVGRQFGVTILPYGDFQLEVATFRQDGLYLDGRRPETVHFSNAEEDAKRRDFTVNALFYDLENQKVIDYVGGQEDIRRQVIRTVGSPDKRFEEDKLRLFRAVRFSAQLGFSIESETLEAVGRLASEIKIVSRERVRDELFKLFKVPGRTQGLELLLSSGLLDALFEDAAAPIKKDPEAWLKPFRALDGRETDLVAMLGLFFLPRFLELRSSVGAAQAERSLRESQLKHLRLENRQIEAVLFAFRHLEDFKFPKRVRRGEMALLLAHPAAFSAEVLIRSIETDPEKRLERDACFNDVRAKSLIDGRTKPPPYLTGEDLKTAGVAAGPKMGKLLQEAYLLQLEGVLTDRESALEWMKNLSKARQPE